MGAPRAIADEETKAMRAHVRRLRRDDPVRSVAQSVLDGSLPGLARIGPLLFALADTSDRRWRRRAVAAWALGRVPMDEAQRQQAARALGEVVRHRVLPARWLSRGVVAILCAAGAAGLLAGICLAAALLWPSALTTASIPERSLAGDAIPGLAWMAAFCACIGTPWASVHLARERDAWVRSHAAFALGQVGCLDAIPALATATRDADPQVRRISTGWLRPLICQLDRDPQYALDTQVVPDLCRLLAATDAGFVNTVLYALARAGDSRAIAPIERLLRGRLDQAVRAQAEAVLSFLRARQEAERNPRLLLRGAAQPGDPADVLLRPAGSAQGEDASNLLRAAEAVGTANEGDS